MPDPTRDGPDPHGEDQEAMGRCLLETATLMLDLWRETHPEATLSTLADGCVCFVGSVLTHLWRQAEAAMPEPPVAWADFVAGMDARFQRALAMTHDACACPACRPVGHC